MNNVQVMDCNQTSGVKLERVNFFNRQLLTADDMTTEADYFLQKLRRHNRFLHGWGVVCGLPVIAAPVNGAPWRVHIGSGYALGPYGDEIFVGESVYFDLAACLTGGATNPCEPNMTTPGSAGTSTTAYIAIKYAECLSRPVQVASSGCGCDNDPCQYSRIRDSFQIQCLTQLPPLPPPVSLCQVVRGAVIAPCPPCPADPWVLLAKVILPASTTMNISNANIDNTARRVIVSTAVLQDQIVRCCCGPASSSSSSSSSSSGAILVPNIQNRGKLSSITVGQRATRVPGAIGATQIAVTVMNSGAALVEDVVVTVNLSPGLSVDLYKLTPTADWKTTNLEELVSSPIALQPGKAHTYSFQISPAAQAPSVKITSKASVSTGSAAVTGTAVPIQATIG